MAVVVEQSVDHTDRCLRWVLKTNFIFFVHKEQSKQ